MYDVLYMDEASRCSVVAAGLSREEAVERARAEARRRRASRMFLKGSDFVPRRNSILIIQSGPQRARRGAG